MKTENDRVLALAGLYQAASLVSQIARQGNCDAEAKKASVHSLFQIDAENTLAVFGGLEGVAHGLHTLLRQLSEGSKGDLEITRYAIQLIQLNGVLQRHPAMLETIGKGLEEAVQRREHFGLTHPNTLAQLADIYSRTISTLQPRIMVQGEPLHLNNPDNANQIRTLLLAGIRAARLWRQCGGKRFQIIFGRNRISGLIRQRLAELQIENP